MTSVAIVGREVAVLDRLASDLRVLVGLGSPRLLYSVKNMMAIALRMIVDCGGAAISMAAIITRAKEYA